jgi:hypothetical protein
MTGSMATTSSAAASAMLEPDDDDDVGLLEEAMLAGGCHGQRQGFFEIRVRGFPPYIGQRKRIEVVFFRRKGPASIRRKTGEPN